MRKIVFACLVCLIADWTIGAGIVPSHEICIDVVDGVAWTYRTGYTYLDTDYGKESPLYQEIGVVPIRGGSNGSSGGAIPALMGVYIGDGTNSAVSVSISGEIKIPSEINGYRVIGISENAFLDCCEITSVIIPNEILTIEEGAFARCRGIQEMTVPFMGKGRGKSSFGAENLLGWFFGRTAWYFSSNSINTFETWEARDFIDDGGRSWNKHWTDHYVEVYCLPLSLTSLTLTDETSLEDSALCGQALTRVKLPQNLKSIYDGMFAGMPISEIEMPIGLSMINNNMFQDCVSLTNVAIPSTVQTIGVSVFRNCMSLKKIGLPENVVAIGDNAFNNSGIEEIPDMPNVTSLSDGIFENCHNLTEVVVPHGVAAIGTRSFYSAKNLKKVILPDTVTSIASGAFGLCPNLVEMNLGCGIENIGEAVFEGTPLTKLDFAVSIRKIASWPEALIKVCIHDVGKWCDVEFASTASRRGDLMLLVNGENVKKVIIPEGVENIADYAFCNYTNIEEVVCPSTVTNIGKFAFSGCKGLHRVIIPNGVTSIGDGAFNGADLEDVIIPDSVVKLGGGAFEGCENLVCVRLSESMTKIEYETFKNCSNLESINLPTGLISIDSDAFLNCSRLENIIIPCELISIGFRAFEGCSSLSGVLRIPEGIKTIDRYAFSGCSSLTGVVIPCSVTSVNNYAFEFCSSLSTALVPSSLMESIPKYAFHGSVLDFRLIGYDGDSKDQVLHTIAFNAVEGNCDVAAKSVADGYAIGKLPTPVRDGWTFTGWFTASDGGEWVWEDSLIHSDATLYAHWIENSELALIEYNISGGVANITRVSDALAGRVELPPILDGYRVWTIKYRAFAGCTNITSVVLPNTLRQIEGMAFYGCSALKSITIPSSVVNIGENAFGFCDGLESVAIPSSVNTVGESAFYHCAGLTSAVIEGGDIGASAFSGCHALTNVAIGGSVTSIGDMAFAGLDALESASISCEATNVMKSVFAHCDVLKKISIDMPIVGDNMFSECTKLEEVAFGSRVKSIGNSAFYNCKGLERIGISDLAAWCAVEFNDYPASARAMYLLDSPDVYVAGKKVVDLVIPDGVECIGQHAFQNFGCLESVTMPDSVTFVEHDAFAGCGSLTNIVFSANVKDIAYGAFRACHGLHNVVVPDSVEYIGDEAFYYCRGLETVTIGRSVADVGSNAFGSCLSLNLALVPSSLKGRLGESVFSGASPDFQILYYDGAAPGIDSIEWRTITFDANGGISDTLSKRVPLGGVVGALPSATRPGHVLGGWQIGGVSGTIATPKTAVSGNMVLYARWVEVENLPVDAFDSTGGNAEWVVLDNGTWKSGIIGDSQITWVRVAVDAPCTVSFSWKVSSEQKYDTLGFYLDGTLKSEISGETDWTTVSLSLTGEGAHDLVWKYIKDSTTSQGDDSGCIKDLAIACFPEFTVTFDENYDGGASVTTNVPIATAIGTLPEPSRPGYAFAGWYTAQAGGSSVTQDTIVLEDVTCYAHWIATTPIVSFDETGGSANWTIEADGSWKSGRIRHDCETWSSITVTAPCIVTFQWKASSEEGYDELSCYIDGEWYDSISGKTDWMPVSLSLEGNSSRTIVWKYTKDESDSDGQDAGWVDNVAIASASSIMPEPETRMVSFDLNGAEAQNGMDAKVIAEGDTIGELPTPTRDGYTFAGWWTEVEGGAEVTATTTVIADMTLFAHWTEKLPPAPTYTETTPVPVRHDWLAKYSGILSAAGNDYEAAAMSPTGKKDGRGNALCVWHDYLAGTDPTNASSVFRAKVEFKNGLPKVGWEPDLNENGAKSERFYKVFGKKTLTANENWTRIVTESDQKDYTFFKVTVNMEETPDTEEDLKFGDGTGNGSGVNGGNERPVSLGTVQDVTASINSVNAVYISWQSVEDATGYEIWRGTELTTNGAVHIATSTETTSYADTQAATGVIYNYFVRAYSQSGLGEFSAPAVGMRLSVPETVTISFNANGGETSTFGGTYTSGNTYGTLPPASRSGYCFAGWWTEVNGGIRVFSSSVVDPAVTTLYAHWYGNGGIDWTIDADGTLSAVSLNGATVATIPDCVYNISNRAFYNMWSLKEATIPNSVTNIGNRAFCWCSSLENINIGTCVANIDSYAFESCRSLRSVTIPDSVTNIGASAFAYCSSMTNMIVGTGVVGIGLNAFGGCTKLDDIEILPGNISYSSRNGVVYNKGITRIICSSAGVKSLSIPETVGDIGDYAFYSCSLTDIDIPMSVTNIGEYAFSHCDHLTSLKIPNSIVAIEEYAFYSCDGLASITLPSSLSRINDGTFGSCENLLEVVIPDSIESIGWGAFSDCTSLHKVVIGNGTKNIETRAFSRCTSLSDVSIGNSLTTIGTYAFAECSSLSTIRIPASVTGIYWGALSGCGNLKSVFIEGDLSESQHVDDIYEDSASDLVTYVTSRWTGPKDTWCGRSVVERN